jgi:hypothetical protein
MYREKERSESQTHDLIRLAGLAVGLPVREVDRLPDDLLGLWVVSLEDELDGRRDKHDAVLERQASEDRSKQDVSFGRTLGPIDRLS